MKDVERYFVIVNQKGEVISDNSWSIRFTMPHDMENRMDIMTELLEMERNEKLEWYETRENGERLEWRD